MGNGNNNYQHKYKNYTFRGKQEDEEIIVMLRRHWIILVVEFIPLIFLLLLLVSEIFFAPLLVRVFPFEISQMFINLISSFMFMFYWIIVFAVWLDYYLDVWIVTDHRIINIEQHGLFRREISELDHEKIQDVTTDVRGVVPTLLKFGNVHIQTAGSKTRFEFKQVPSPMLVRTMIMKLQKQAMKENKIEEGALLRGKA